MLASAWMLPPAFASSSPTTVPERHLADAEHQDEPEAEPDEDRQDPLPLDRLDDRVGGVDADQHQHEQEQHQDRAGVDDDLHREEERRVERRRTAPPG